MMSDYKLDIAFSGGDGRLTRIDAAQWAPPGNLLAFGANANSPQSSSAVVLQPSIHFKSADGHTKVDLTLSVYVSTGLGTLSLRVINDGVISVKSPVDSFQVNTPGQSDHVLKLR
jgi:hypothetical protein